MVCDMGSTPALKGISGLGLQLSVVQGQFFFETPEVALKSPLFVLHPRLEGLDN